MWEEVRAAVRIVTFHSYMVELEVAAAVVITVAMMAAESSMSMVSAILAYLAETYTGRQRQQELLQAESVEES